MAPSKRILQPNEKATIHARMDGRRFSGHKSVAIWVTVGPHYISEVKLVVTAFSRDDLICVPDEVAFGSVERGQTPSATVNIEYLGPLAWQVREAIVPKGAPFEA